MFELRKIKSILPTVAMTFMSATFQPRMIEKLPSVLGLEPDQTEFIVQPPKFESTWSKIVISVCGRTSVEYLAKDTCALVNAELNRKEDVAKRARSLSQPKVLVFCMTKKMIVAVADILRKTGKYEVVEATGELVGDPFDALCLKLSEPALKTLIVVSTSLLASGPDFKGISHVFALGCYGPDCLVQMFGRTGRDGEDGNAYFIYPKAFHDDLTALDQQHGRRSHDQQLLLSLSRLDDEPGLLMTGLGEEAIRRLVFSKVCIVTYLESIFDKSVDLNKRCTKCSKCVSRLSAPPASAASASASSSSNAPRLGPQSSVPRVPASLAATPSESVEYLDDREVSSARALERYKRFDEAEGWRGEDICLCCKRTLSGGTDKCFWNKCEFFAARSLKVQGCNFCANQQHNSRQITAELNKDPNERDRRLLSQCCVLEQGTDSTTFDMCIFCSRTGCGKDRSVLKKCDTFASYRSVLFACFLRWPDELYRDFPEVSSGSGHLGFKKLFKWATIGRFTDADGNVHGNMTKIYGFFFEQCTQERQARRG
jgi:hypothetical protein